MHKNCSRPGFHVKKRYRPSPKTEPPQRRPQHYDSTRYYGVNLHNVWYRGTVEFRWFEGTLHAGKVKAYVWISDWRFRIVDYEDELRH